MPSSIYTHATVVTVNAENHIIVDGALRVEGNRIVAIGKTSELLRSASEDGSTIIDLTGKIVIPGLVNAHAHLAQSLLRGLAEEVPLHSWLCDSIWPMEASYQKDDGVIASKLTMAEMLKSGTTCFLEALLPAQSDVDKVCQAVGDMGLRACLGKLVKVQDDASSSILADARDKDMESMSIKRAIQVHSKFQDAFEGRLQIWMAAVTPRGSSRKCHSEIGEACRKHDIGLTMHCAEAPKDLDIYRDEYDCSPMEFCRDTSLAGHKTVLAHMVNLDLEKDLPILRETGTSVAHNPSSNCKLASGIACVPEMLAAGVNVCLGTDGAPCSNNYDMIAEMRMASLIHKGRRQDAALMSAVTVLRLATINGARALGLDRDIGSLEIGKKADFAVIDPSSLAAAPFDPEGMVNGGCDPITTLVYSCSGADVDMVVVDGKILVRNRKLTQIDEQELKHKARVAIRGIRQRSGISSTVHTCCKYV